jgi:hypothetical protein
MNNKVKQEVDVLSFMYVTFPVSHLEMSALNAAANRNTTHHPNVENNGREKVEGKKGCQTTNKQQGGELKEIKETNQ